MASFSASHGCAPRALAGGRSRPPRPSCATRARWPVLRLRRCQHQHPQVLAAAAGNDDGRSAAAAATTPLDDAAAVSLPTTPEQQVALAADAVVSAWRAGQSRQTAQIELPLIGASDLDDWPGGIRQQFKAALPLVEELLRRVRAAAPQLSGPLSAEIWDDGDAVGAWTPKAGGRRGGLSCVLFPTAQTLDRLRALADAADDKATGSDGAAPTGSPASPPPPNSLTLIVNPQFQPDLSDYGGPFAFGRADALRDLQTFKPSFCFARRRVFGDDVYTFRAHPASWKAAVVRDSRAGPGAGGGGARLLLESDGEGPAPSYADVERALRARPDSAVNMPLGERLQREWAWNQRSLQEGPPPPKS
jgi:hypothetical protein